MSSFLHPLFQGGIGTGTCELHSAPWNKSIVQKKGIVLILPAAERTNEVKGREEGWLYGARGGKDWGWHVGGKMRENKSLQNLTTSPTSFWCWSTEWYTCDSVHLSSWTFFFLIESFKIRECMYSPALS